MKKEEYIKPEIKIILLQSYTQLLAGSSFQIYQYYNEDEDEMLDDPDKIL